MRCARLANDVGVSRTRPYYRRTSTRVSMPVPAPLSKKLREALGLDAGEELVTWMHEMRTEHDELLAAIHADFAEYRHEMAALIQGSESRLLERIHLVEVTLGDRIGKVEVRVAEVKADLMKWSFVFWVGAVLAVATLAGVLRN